jgi:iron complex transport system substrate-binding protein
LISIRRISRFLAVLSLAFAACDKQSSQLATLRDDFGDPIRIDQVPTRIVSLSPATTEILFALGAGPRVIGRSDFDLWPAGARTIPALGNGIQPNVEAVLGIHPDLVIL